MWRGGARGGARGSHEVVGEEGHVGEMVTATLRHFIVSLAP